MIIKIIISILSIIFVTFCLNYYFNKIKPKFPFGICNLFLFSYILIIYIGSLVLFLGLDPIARDVLNITDENILLLMVFLCTVFFLLFIVGVKTADHFFHYGGRKIDEWLNNEAMPFFQNGGLLVLFLFTIILSICSIVLYQYLQLIPRIPLFAIFSSEHSPMYYRTSAVGDLFEGKIWWFQYFYTHIPVFFSFVLVAETTLVRKKIWPVVTIVLVIYCLFITSFDAQKAPMLWYIIALSFIYVQQKYKTVHIFSFKLIILFVLCICIIVLMYLFLMGRDLETSLIEGPHRLITGQLGGLYGIINQFTGQPLMGRTFPPFILSFFDVNFYNLDQEMKMLVYGISSNARTIGLANTVYFGEVYANFGLIICLFSMFLVPFYMRTVEILIASKFRKTSLTYGFYIFTMMHFKDFSGSRIFSSIPDVPLLFILFIVFLFMACRKETAKILGKQEQGFINENGLPRSHRSVPIKGYL